MKKSKSCEEMIGQNDSHENNELIETTSLHSENTIDERYHNRFSLANRQKLISQQQAIDQKVKLTRLEQATKRQQPTSNRFLTKISSKLKRPTTISKSLDDTQNQSNQQHVPRVSITSSSSLDSSTKIHSDNIEDENITRPSVIYVPDRRISHYQQKPKMYNIDEDTPIADENTNIEGGKEMILTATKLITHLTPSSSATNDKS